MKKTFILLLSIVINNAIAQTRTDNWTFGENSGINISALDHTVSVLNNINIYAPASATTISDNNGNLVLYSNGGVSVNKDHQFIKTNKEIGGEFNKAQSSIIIPKPGSSNIYYVFGTRVNGSPNIFDPISPGLYYSEVDVEKKEIVKKRTAVLNTPTTKVTAVHHIDGKSIWLVTIGMHTFDNDSKPSRAFFSIKISDKGIEEDINIKKIRGNGLPKDGALKISPDGTKIAFASLEDGIFVYNFNTNNGTVSGNLNLPKIHPLLDFSVYGLEFSVNSEFIYTSSKDEDNFNNIHQYDLTSSNKGFKYDLIFKSKIKSNYGALQLANNGKIYHSINFGNGITDNSKYLGYINNPNKKSNLVTYNHNAIDLGAGKSYLGLPAFIQSYFRTKITTVHGCINLPTKFNVDTYTKIDNISWDYGDGNTGNGVTPTHVYKNTGIYNVTAIVSYDNQKVKVTKEIEIFPLPKVTNGLSMSQCEPIDNSKIYFNLNEISPKITDDYKLKGFVFYETEPNAISGKNHISDPDKYELKSKTKDIFVRVVDLKGCYSIAQFTLKTTTSKLQPIPSFYSCQDSNSSNVEGVFKISNLEKNIRIAQNITNTTKLRFFDSFLNAQITIDGQGMALEDLNAQVDLLVNNVSFNSASVAITSSNNFS